MAKVVCPKSFLPIEAEKTPMSLNPNSTAFLRFCSRISFVGWNTMVFPVNSLAIDAITKDFPEPVGRVRISWPPLSNVFRPDSPLEENRTFRPGIIDHVDDYHLMIFNRWGELIYESFDQETGWDGFYNGQLAKQDVYIWKVTGTFSDGKGFTKTGNVTLLY